MTNYRTGDLLLVMFPFAHGGRGKQRPALVLLDDGDDDVLLARVTTQDRHTRFDIRVADWQDAGLLAPSVVRLHKLATIHKSLVKRHLGSLSEKDRASVASILSRTWQAW
jgi:mRNA interferase MazF